MYTCTDYVYVFTIVDKTFTLSSLKADWTLTVIFKHSSVDTRSTILAQRVADVNRKVTHTSYTQGYICT